MRSAGRWTTPPPGRVWEIGRRQRINQPLPWKQAVHVCKKTFAESKSYSCPGALLGRRRFASFGDSIMRSELLSSTRSGSAGGFMQRLPRSSPIEQVKEQPNEGEWEEAHRKLRKKTSMSREPNVISVIAPPHPVSRTAQLSKFLIIPYSIAEARQSVFDII